MIFPKRATINNVSDANQKILSRNGLNILQLTKGQPPSLNQIYFTIYVTRQKIEECCYDTIDSICETTFFKKETLFKGIWIYKNNVIVDKLYDIICENKKKRDAVIHRLDMMLMVLRATFDRYE